MIKSWDLQNFKSVKKLNSIEFAPLTIFAGANSSGKSTILQSILLTAQTLQNSFNEKSIILNGHISKFGTFDDILSNGSKDDKIEIGFVLKPEYDESNLDYSRYFIHSPKVEEFRCIFSFSKTINGKTNELLQLQPKLVESYIEVKNKEKNEGGKIHIVRSKKSVEQRLKELNIEEDRLGQNLSSTLDFEVKTNTFKPNRYRYRPYIENVINKYVGASLKHFLPFTITFDYDEIELEKSQLIQLLLLNEQSYDYDPEYLFEHYVNKQIQEHLVILFREVIDEISKLNDKPISLRNDIKKIEHLINDFNYNNYINLPKRNLTFRTILQKITDSKGKIISFIKTDKKNKKLESNFVYDLEYIEIFFKNNLKYLGPLRDEPKPVYPLSLTSDPTNVGFRGENTAAVLDINRNVNVKYIKPEDLTNSHEPKAISHGSLMSAVLCWLKYMGIAEKIDSSDKGKLGHELKISTPNSSALHDLTHVGVGVSQVLPILVLSLLSKSDSTLIFEQPELHLNPKVQTRLADFFYSMTLLQKQCLVETHSEYLINRLRYLVATSKNDKIADNSLIYFVEKSEGFSNYRKININKYGVIDEWPIGFFDENEETASLILKAAMAKREDETRSKI